MSRLNKEIAGAAGIRRVVSNKVFIVMSFSGNPILETYYNRAIKPCIEGFGLEPVRVDQVQFNGKISNQIEDGLKTAKFVIVDLTEDRPNCYFEAGYAVALGKDVIFQRLNAPGYEPKIEFDVKDFNHIIYTTDDNLKLQLHARIEAIF